MWQSSTWFKSALPKYGIITGGWPKTQIIKEKFNKNKKQNNKNLRFYMLHVLKMMTKVLM